MTDAPSRTFSWTAPNGDGMTGIDLPFDPRAVFGKVRAPVVVTLGGYSYRSTIFAMNGRIWVPLRRSHREAAAIGSGVFNTEEGIGSGREGGQGGPVAHIATPPRSDTA